MWGELCAVSVFKVAELFRRLRKKNPESRLENGSVQDESAVVVRTIVSTM